MYPPLMTEDLLSVRSEPSALSFAVNDQGFIQDASLDARLLGTAEDPNSVALFALFARAECP
jgi:hypothetical protein